MSCFGRRKSATPEPKNESPSVPPKQFVGVDSQKEIPQNQNSKTQEPPAKAKTGEKENQNPGEDTGSSRSTTEGEVKLKRILVKREDSFYSKIAKTMDEKYNSGGNVKGDGVGEQEISLSSTFLVTVFFKIYLGTC